MNDRFDPVRRSDFTIEEAESPGFTPLGRYEGEDDALTNP